MDETVPIEAVVPAPETELTAAPAPAETETPEVPAEQDAPKTFSQEELDAIVGKRLAREQRKWEREYAARATNAGAQPAATSAADIAPEQFDTYEAYADALAERKADELVAKREAARQTQQAQEQYYDREDAAREKYPDFEQVAYNPRIDITQTMAQAIQASEDGPDVLYWLGSNPKEATRLSRLSPILQVKEIGKLEALLSSSPPAKKVSTAPEPIAPVTPRANGGAVYDTTDPRSVKNMSTSEWIAAERLRQIKRYEATRNR